MNPGSGKPFTGRHMTMILVAFFGVVIAVNLVMARFAIGTFGGTVVDNSYVASQKFNGWLEQARQQEALGWESTVTLDGARHAVVRVMRAGAPLAGVAAKGAAHHPLGREPSRPLAFAEIAPGTLRADAPLPAGRWTLHLTLRHGEQEIRRIETVQ